MTGSGETERMRLAAPIVGDAEIEAITRVMKSGNMAQGPETAGFETEFATWCGAPHAVAVSSGTTALHTALLAHGIGPGDSVLTTPFTFIATANAILMAGARPLFADINPADFNLDPAKAEQAIEPDTKAIIAVHLYGQAADLGALRSLASDRGLILIEDACQSHGARFEGDMVGLTGTACYSFYPTKNMTTGEGGIMTTDDEEADARARMIRSHGSRIRYHHEILGYNYRMTDLAAAIGRVQLTRVDEFNDRRRRNAERLTEALKGIPGLETPRELAGRRHVYHQYAVRIKPDFPLDRETFQKELAANGIDSDIHYPVTVTRQPLYDGMGVWPELPEAQTAAAEVLSLPVQPGLTVDDMDRLAESIRRIIS